MDYKAKTTYKNHKEAGTYDEKRFTTLKGNSTDKLEKALINKALTFLKISPPSTILDAPCGTGRLSIHLAKRGFEVRAVDISFEMARRIAPKIAGTGYFDRIKTSIVDIETLPFVDNSFEVVVSLRLFGHVPPQKRALMLKEFARVGSSYYVLAYYHKHCLQHYLRGRKQEIATNRWFPVTYADIKNELAESNLKLLKIFPMVLGYSETLLVCAQKKT